MDSDREQLLEKFQGKRGQDFVDALVDELLTLHSQVHEAEATIERLKVYADYSDQIAALNAAAAAEALPLLTSYEVKADQFFRSEVNVYGLEYTGDGVPYRWTGPERETTFLMPLDRSETLQVTLDFVCGEQPEVKLPLVLLVDGRPVDFKLVEGNRTQLVAPIVPRPEGSDMAETAPTAVTVIVRRTLQPSNEDDRLLGIGFFGLSVVPLSQADRGRPSTLAVAGR